eukprot:Skav231067  [mRNA]  locus=scaffold524:41617:47142:- [translate_table: standard]
MVEAKNFVADAEWFWFLFHSLGQGDWHGHTLLLPGKPRTVSPCEMDKIVPQSKPISSSGQLHIRLATCNVLTLQPDDQVQAGSLGLGPSRARSLFRQFHAAGLHLFAWQETRCAARHRCLDENYIVVQSPADSKGNYGMLIGLSKTIPHGTLEDGKTVSFTTDSYSVISLAPRFIILRISTPTLRCILVAAHAPHRGESCDVISDFWQGLVQMIPCKYDGWDRLLLCDANAEIGAFPSPSIGTWQSAAGAVGEKNGPFVDFVHSQALKIPASFEHHHSGSGYTWRHQRGTLKRIDFVGIPLRWEPELCSSWIDYGLEVALEHDDHFAACVEVCLPLAPAFPSLVQSTPQPRRTSMEDLDWHQFYEACSLEVPAQMDVHAHALLLQQRLSKAFIRSKKREAKPLKASMSASTWQLLLDKRMERKTLAQAQRLQRHTALLICFEAWQYYRAEDEDEDVIWVQPDFEVNLPAVRSLLKDQDHLIATTYHRFRCRGRELTAAMRRDDRAFYDSCLQDLGEFCSAAQAKQFWGIVRRSMPKFRVRRLQCDPGRIEAFEEQWGPHFRALELGHSCCFEDIWADCQSRQAATPPAVQVLRPSDLPSLREVEDACREVRADRATGFDDLPSALTHMMPHWIAHHYYGLFVKIFAWQSEPLFFKGGMLATLPKKPICSSASDYRGVLLLPTISKRLHNILRQRLMSTLQRQRPPGQMGGYPHQEVLFGSQCLRTFGRLMDSRSISSGLLFIDLTQAFHRLIREMVVGVGAEQSLIDVLHGLACENGDVAAVSQRLGLPTLLQELGVSPLLQKLLMDIHQETWFTLKHQFEVVVTRRGTRPGSPLADIIFHIVMWDVARDLRAWLSRQTDLQAIAAECDVVIEPIFWSDDLAIPWASRHASALAAEMGRLMRVVRQLFHKRGFTLNMNKGKTSAILTFRGKGAPACRQQHLLTSMPSLDCPPDGDDDDPLSLPLVSKYKHLGTYVTEDHSLDQELAVRIGMAQQMFSTLARPVLCNRHLPLSTRVRLYRTLIESRLYFGLGAWATPTKAQLARLQATVLRFLHRILRLSLDQRTSMSVQEVFVRTGVAQPRVRLAIDRLLYARRFLQHAPEFIIHMVMKEHQLTTDSWLHGVCMDLQWVDAVRPNTLPAGWEHDLTDFFDWIQNPATPWKRIIAQVWQRHLKQEEIGLRTLQMHKLIFRELRALGATFEPAPFEDLDPVDQVYECECGRTFSSGQGLSTHRRKAHGHFSAEHHLLQGSCCPCCLRQFWSTQRLQQHLAYRSRRTGLNSCFQQLQSWGVQVPYEPCKIPADFAGLHRVEALRVEGPVFHRKDVRQQEMDLITEDLATLGAGLRPATVPADIEDCRALLFDDLSLTTRDWFQAFVAAGHEADPEVDLADMWLEVLLAGPDDLHDWAALQFLDWGSEGLPLVCEGFVDGEAEGLADQAFYLVAEALPQFGALQHRDRLHQRLRYLQEIVDTPFPHRGTREHQRPAMRRSLPIAAVSRAYDEQVHWHDNLRRIRWTTMPPLQPTPMYRPVSQRPCFLICHLFSGRRRSGDFHDQMHLWAERRGFEVCILSMDTAVSEWYGDLSTSAPSWRQLESLYSKGWVAATLCGPPCETWTEARHNPPPTPAPGGRSPRWPRPLRSMLHAFGLEGLTMREMRQLDFGTMFVLNMLRLCCSHVGRGGCFVMEHPGPPSVSDRASVWSLALTQLLRQHHHCGFHVLSQWRWGALACKPTGFLTVGMPRFWHTMWQHHLPELRRPERVAIGVDQNNQFKTAVLKEYPAQLCKALAESIGSQLESDWRAGNVRAWSGVSTSDPSVTDSPLCQWVQEAAALSTQIRANAPMGRDYQG